MLAEQLLQMAPLRFTVSAQFAVQFREFAENPRRVGARNRNQRSHQATHVGVDGAKRVGIEAVYGVYDAFDQNRTYQRDAGIHRHHDSCIAVCCAGTFSSMASHASFSVRTRSITSSIACTLLSTLARNNRRCMYS